jgi:hypothetical protein
MIDFISLLMASRKADAAARVDFALFNPINTADRFSRSLAEEFRYAVDTDGLCLPSPLYLCDANAQRNTVSLFDALEMWPRRSVSNMSRKRT